MVNLFYKSNQARLNAYNKQRSQDLINQLKQKERINALNQQQEYNDEVANELAKLYAKFIETEPYKKSNLQNALMNASIQMEMRKANKMKTTLPSSSIPMLEAPPSPLPIESKKSSSAPSSLSGSPLISELKGILNVDPEEKKKIDSMTVAQLKNYLDSKNIPYKSKDKRQDLRNIVYTTLPKIKPEGSGIFIRKKHKVHRFK